MAGNLTEDIEAPVGSAGQRAKRLAASWPSPQYLVTRALMLGVLFFLAHIAGLRDYTAFLSGTAAGQTTMGWSVFYGTAYIALYLGAIVLAPILVIAAALLILWERLVRDRLGANTIQPDQ
jgi:hypothetical protein